MRFSNSSINHFEFSLFLKKCKQTAEISWFFFWDVKISKKFIKENFVIFYRYFRTYLSLCSPSSQCEISHLPNIHFRLFVVIFKRKNLDWIFQLILPLWVPLWFMSIGISTWPNGTSAKLDYLTKPVKNLKIFVVTLTKT